MQFQNFRACAQNGSLRSLPISPGSGTKPESLGSQLFKEQENRLVKDAKDTGTEPGQATEHCSAAVFSW